VEWTVTNLIIEVIAGWIGGLAAAAAVDEHSFGFIGHSVTGLIGGALSGYFLQTAVGTMVDSTGVANAPEPVSQAILQALGGLVAGAALTFVVGFIKHSLERHAAEK
jgi:uncharacterized membrane protein YeaQ/YmgE (transglycosylase-associated protein family)